ncbi:MAG: 30S ribosomal protein S13 [Verrucomicrobiota bacterium]|nr:30S ribosomal protein S13 [Verrucomicrobiota bacterium]
MPRILGVDIPANKKLVFALRYIYGIGPTRAQAIVAEAGFDADRRAGDLSEEELNQLSTIVADKQYIVEGDLRREVTANLKRLSAIRSWRGIRHQRGLPVRGQRTKTNARTRKGAVKPIRK